MGNPRGIIFDIDYTDTDDIYYVYLDYYDPITISVDAEYRETYIRLRSEPHHTYVSTRAKTLPISAILVASSEQGDQGTPDVLMNKIRFLESLNYPDYGDTGDLNVKPPHRVRILLEGIIDDYGYMKGLSVEFEDLVDVDKKQLVAKIRFTFVIMHNTPLSYKDVRVLGARYS